jgi:hypothetical protein
MLGGFSLLGGEQKGIKIAEYTI